MVLHRRLNYGFNGYEVPPIPRAARSIRKRGPLRNKVGDNQMCAFDLLATVAGKILLEGEILATATNEICENEGIIGAVIPVKQELRDDNGNLLNSINLSQGSPEIGQVVDKQESQVQNKTDKEIVNPLKGSSSRPIAASGWKDTTDLNENKVLDDRNSRSISLLREVKGCSSGDINFCVPKQEDQVTEHTQSHPVTISKGPFGVGPGNFSSSEDPKLLDQELPALVNSDTSVKLYLNRDHYSCGSPFLSRDNVKVVSRDDDENPSRCTQRNMGMKTTRSRALTRSRRIRKLLASKYWRRPSKVKYQDLSDTAGELHSVNQYQKTGFKRQRSRRIYPLKKRKLFYSSPSTSDGVTGYKNIYMCSEGTDTSTAYGALGHKANGMLSVVASQSTSFQSRESHVKVRVKSFRVPELFIELPETATVGSLKRTVMEAITTLLGGELRVGVVLKGRKIKDDSKTLVQTGISHDNKVDSLGFTLEPNHSQVYSSMSSEDTPSIQMPHPVSRLAAPAANIAHQIIHASADNQAKDFADFIKSDHDSELIPAKIAMENGAVDPKALITVPEASTEALEVVPPTRMSKRYEMAQRRMRRPFSVAEVEALVGAVEKLGTGRWRDVKLLAFDNAEHRTYVDLKDKWKTLVHTARISPQQRRGEPVPQELLDRVLAAHGYWSQQQPKQQLKQQSEARLLVQGRDSD